MYWQPNPDTSLSDNLEYISITVMFSSKVFQFDSYTWRGTVRHEFTHAHDYWDLADYLAVTEMDDIYDYQFYEVFRLWSEYRARKAGASNVFKQEYAHFSTPEIFNICNISFEQICHNLISASTAYDAMQDFGRYSALKELYSDKMPSIQIANEKNSLKKALSILWSFCSRVRNLI